MFLRYFLPLCVFLAINLSLFSAPNEQVQDGSRFDQELNERDFDALRQFLNTKREGALDDKDDNLNISGDMRFEYRHLNEMQDHCTLRGDGRKNPRSNVPVSRNDWDCEFNLKFDYYLDKTWAVAHLQFDNSAGVDSEDLSCADDPRGWFGSGRCDDICLRKSYMGYSVWKCPESSFIVELGRRGNLYHVFDSRVQFLSRFDGLLLKWSGKQEGAFDWFLHAAGFVVDERVNHLAYATEVGFLNIMGTGVDFKYSFIDWCGQVGSRCLLPDDKAKKEQELADGPDCCKEFKYRHRNRAKAFDFAISQFTLAYTLPREWLCVPAKVYGAFLFNHKGKYITALEKAPGECKRTIEGRRSRENLAWYVGLLLGKITGKEGDWSLEFQYQVVQALAVPGQDCSGICNGNVFDYTLTALNNRQIDNTNYRGWKVEGLYALTDNITIDAIAEQSWADNPHIGGVHRYSKVELEAIYAF